jgi:hypothetical protein
MCKETTRQALSLVAPLNVDVQRNHEDG